MRRTRSAPPDTDHHAPSPRLRARVGVSALLLALVATAGTVRAQEGGAKKAPSRPKPCAAPEFRQFDFWVGEWEVWTKRLRERGGPPARSRISLVEGGCVLQEEYTNGQYSGRSLNYYDRRDGKWHQVWIDNAGNPIVQVGGMQGGSMVLDSPGPDGARNRITWTPNEDGTVRQHWTRTRDGGETWETVFDGTYHPREE